eukprot:7152432-Prymnesium_polylepis.1
MRSGDTRTVSTREPTRANRCGCAAPPVTPAPLSQVLHVPATPALGRSNMCAIHRGRAALALPHPSPAPPQ